MPVLLNNSFTKLLAYLTFLTKHTCCTVPVRMAEKEIPLFGFGSAEEISFSAFLNVLRRYCTTVMLR